MADVLILGGTRDIGHAAAVELLVAGHSVTVLNRGRTPDELPGAVRRIRADRTHRGDLKRALRGREFDLVLDTTTYDEPNASEAVETFSDRVGRYVFISTGQVYLVRAGLERPFRETDYDGPLSAEPEPGTADHDSWRYGVEKRAAEEVFGRAWTDTWFPVTTLRLPIVASERDPGGRVQAYAARITDGGPLLLPVEQGPPLRHVYVRDVARLVAGLIGTKQGIGQAVNVSPDESLGLEDFLVLLADALGRRLSVLRLPREQLDDESLLPDCSPFSSQWMSELDGSLSRRVFASLGPRYTAPAEYLGRIVADYRGRWLKRGLIPRGYQQRERELALAQELRPGASRSIARDEQQERDELHR